MFWDGVAAALLSSAQEVVEVCVAGCGGLSTSAGSLGTISKDSSIGSAAPAVAPALSHCFSAAALAKSSPVEAWTGDLRTSGSSVAAPLVWPAWISVSPALAMVGSVAGGASVASGAGSVEVVGSGTDSTQPSSCWYGACSTDACLIWESDHGG